MRCLVFFVGLAMGVPGAVMAQVHSTLDAQFPVRTTQNSRQTERQQVMARVEQERLEGTNWKWGPGTYSFLKNGRLAIHLPQNQSDDLNTKSDWQAEEDRVTFRMIKDDGTVIGSFKGRIENNQIKGKLHQPKAPPRNRDQEIIMQKQ